MLICACASAHKEASRGAYSSSLFFVLFLFHPPCVCVCACVCICVRESVPLLFAGCFRSRARGTFFFSKKKNGKSETGKEKRPGEVDR